MSSREVWPLKGGLGRLRGVLDFHDKYPDVEQKWLSHHYEDLREVLAEIRRLKAENNMLRQAGPPRSG